MNSVIYRFDDFLGFWVIVCEITSSFYNWDCLSQANSLWTFLNLFLVRASCFKNARTIISKGLNLTGHFLRPCSGCLNRCRGKISKLQELGWGLECSLIFAIVERILQVVIEFGRVKIVCHGLLIRESWTRGCLWKWLNEPSEVILEGCINVWRLQWTHKCAFIKSSVITAFFLHHVGRTVWITKTCMQLWQ